MFLPRRIMEDKLRHFLTEDIGQGDVTTALVVPADTFAEAVIVSKESGLAAGVEEVYMFLKDLGLDVQSFVKDGESIVSGKSLMKIRGDARTILSVERTVLNLLSRMSGIATVTRELVKKLRREKLKTKIACTRKTAPGLLYFDKKAVWLGGGDPHRLHLDDMVLIKDNHIVVAGGVAEAIRQVKKMVSFSKKIEIEVTKVDDVLEAVEAGADVVMLDNFTVEQVREAVALLVRRKLRGKVLLEASGGISGEQVLDFAHAGVDVVSLGELTQEASALDLSLEITRLSKARKRRAVSRVQ